MPNKANGSNRPGIAMKFIVNLLRFKGEMDLIRIDGELRKEPSIAYSGGYGYRLVKSHLKKLESLGYIISKTTPLPSRGSSEADGQYRIYYARLPVDLIMGGFYLLIERDKHGNLLPFPFDSYLAQYLEKFNIRALSYERQRKAGLREYDKEAERNKITWMDVREYNAKKERDDKLKMEEWIRQDSSQPKYVFD
jgi:hypothetical protein